MKQNKKIFDTRLLVLTIISLATLMLVFNVIHEMGHGILCQLAENHFVWGITPIGGGWLVCLGPMEDLLTFRLAGGLLASVVASVSLLCVILFGKKMTYLAIPLVVIAASQAVTAVFEAFVFGIYMNSSLSHVVTGLITVTLVILLVFRYTKKELVRNV